MTHQIRDASPRGFRRLLSNVGVLLLLATTALSISVYVDLFQHTWVWTPKSGALIAGLGTILSIRPLVKVSVQQAVQSQHTIDGGPSNEASRIIGREETKKDVKATLTGAAMILIGATVNGYGDILMKWIVKR